MNIRIQYILAVCIFSLFSQLAQAQTDSNTDGEVQDAEIIIEKERKIELNKERKLYEFIKWRPEKAVVRSIPGEFKWYVYDVSDEPVEFEPISAPVLKKEKSYLHYGKAGFGNYASPLLDVSITAPVSTDQMLGVNIKHESFATGEVDGKNSGTAASEVNVYGAMIFEKIKLASELNYRREKNNYYGYPIGTLVDNSSLAHQANFFNLGMTATDNNPEDSWDYYAGINFKNYSDNFSAKENILGLEVNAEYSEKLFFTSEVNIGNYKDTGIDDSRAYFRLNPYYRLVLDELILDVGMSISLQNDDYQDLNTTRIFPYAKAQYSLIPNYTLFAKLDGGFTYNSLYGFSSDIGVLNQSVGLANSERLLDFSGGITGSPMTKMSITANAGFQSVRYLPIWINNATDQSRIDLIYDTESSKIFTLKGEVEYEVNQDHQLSLAVNFYQYSSKGYDQIYHRPTSKILISGNHQLIPKLNAKWNFTFLGGLVARDQMTDQDIDLDAIPKLDLELHYQLKENWGIFLLGENLINKNYSRYLYYPLRGIQVKGGVTFRL